jgi:hypothetical protein
MALIKGSGPEPGALYLRMNERPARLVPRPGQQFVVRLWSAMM